MTSLIKPLLLLLCITSHFVLAHQGTLKGHVYDLTTKKPLASATVQIAGTNLFAVTDEVGAFKIKSIDAGSYQASVFALGFEKEMKSFKISNAETTALDFHLRTGAIELSELKVRAPNAHGQQLISSIDIRLRPVNNSQEVLRMVPGLFIGQHAGGGKAEQIFLRGFDIDHGTHISISADGIAVNMVSHAHGQGYADLHFIIPELIEDVSFKKGPYTAEKGNFATAGWVDFQIRDVLDRSFVKVEAGQFDTYRGMGGFDLLSDQKKQRGESSYVAGEYRFSNSYFNSPQHFKRINGMAKYNRKIGENNYLNASVSHFYSKWNHSGQIPDRAVTSGLISYFGAIDDREGGETSRTNASLKLTTQLPNGGLLKNQLYYSHYDFTLYSNFTFFLVDSINGDQIKQKEKRDILGYNGSYTRAGYLRYMPTETSFGVTYRQDLTDSSELSRTVNRSVVSSRLMLGNIYETNLGVYVSETVTLKHNLSLNASLRYDQFFNRYQDLLTSTNSKAKAGIWSPKINLYYIPVKNLQLYVNAGKGFHSNDTRAGGDPVVVAQKGKDILPPAYGTDLGLNWKPAPRLFLNVAAWYLWLKQEFVYVGDEGVVEASGRTRRKGIDLTARYQISKYLFADTDVNLAQPRSLDEEKGNDYIPLAPVFTSTGGFTFKKPTGWNGSLRYRYMADRAANEDYSIEAKGYFIADALINYSQKRYNVGLSAMNILNTKWRETQFATKSRLKNESQPVEEIHFTAGSPFFAKLAFTFYLK